MTRRSVAEVWAVRLVWAGLFGFVALAAASMHHYPGGNFLESHTRGHRFWLNFWCDLLKPRLENGYPNVVGARFAMASFAALTAAVLPFFWLAMHAAGKNPKWSASLLALGLVGSLGLVAVPLSRWLGSASLHSGGIMVGAPAGLLAVSLILRTQLRRTAKPSVRRLGAFGAFALCLSWINLALYCRELWSDAAPTVALPIVQKCATLALLAWVALTAPALTREHE